MPGPISLTMQPHSTPSLPPPSPLPANPSDTTNIDTNSTYDTNVIHGTDTTGANSDPLTYQAHQNRFRGHYRSWFTNPDK
nr:hypothetical transcript [Hymenolepis microstoma]